MKREIVYLKKWLPVFFLSLLVFGACKKKKFTPDETGGVTTPPALNRTQLTQDSIYLYAKQTYYWNSTLPDYTTFNPRQFTTNDAELFALTKYSLNPATGKNYEYNSSNTTSPKYSFIDNGSVATQLGGTGGDYGFSVFYAADNDLRVKYVYATSSAETKGLKRGFQITKINGRTDLVSSNSANIDFVVAAIFGTNPTVDLTIKKPDGSTADVTVSKGSYAINPVLYTNVYTAGTKKIGYIVFNSFTTNAETKLKEAITSFTTQGVSELIVDLRYNGGGSVQTAELLTNLIAPSAATGSTMYDTYFNETMQTRQATILKNQKFIQNNQQYSYYDFDYTIAGNSVKFAKTGALNVNRVYFIVTGSTASASELLINNLKPVLDVKLIGRKTYGKPVGFFAIRIDKLDMYIPQFETKNRLGVGGYYDGLTVDKDDLDDVTKDFGDPTERLLSYALKYANTGAFSVSSPDTKIASAKTATLSVQEADDLTDRFDRDQFKGMLYPKLKLKKD